MIRTSKAYYIDDGVVIKGSLLKNFYDSGYTFYPSNLGCGFTSQYIKESDIGESVFYRKRDAQIGSTYIDKLKNKDNEIQKLFVKLQIKNEMQNKLEAEVNRLSELISDKVGDCCIGVWCKDCVHYGTDQSMINLLATGFRTYQLKKSGYVTEVKGRVMYCKKHLHDICKEFKSNKNNFTNGEQK